MFFVSFLFCSAVAKRNPLFVVVAHATIHRNPDLKRCVSSPGIWSLDLFSSRKKQNITAAFPSDVEGSRVAARRRFILEGSWKTFRTLTD